VRCVTSEQSKATRRPAGMAVAFDEMVSRSKRKELVALVLDLCAKRPEKKAAPPPQPAAPQMPEEPPEEAPEEPPEEPAQEEDESDALLDEIDSLLDSVDDELGDDSEETQPELMAPGFKKKKPAPTPEPAKPPPVPAKAKEPADEPETEPEIQKPPPLKLQDPVKKLKARLADYARSLKGDTYYDTLCIGKQAGPAEIEAAYKKLLAELNPPGGPNSLPPELLRNLSVVLSKIRKAYAILSKPDRKRAYDFLIDNETE